MIIIDKVTMVDYSALISGNKGEEQLVISISMGQGGYTRYMRHAIAVDMTMRIAPETKLVPTKHLLEQIQSDVFVWAEGTPGKDGPWQCALQMGKMHRAIRKIVKYWQIED